MVLSDTVDMEGDEIIAMGFLFTEKERGLVARKVDGKSMLGGSRRAASLN